jgi:hypothetical protein
MELLDGPGPQTERPRPGIKRRRSVRRREATKATAASRGPDRLFLAELRKLPTLDKPGARVKGERRCRSCGAKDEGFTRYDLPDGRITYLCKECRRLLKGRPTTRKKRKKKRGKPRPNSAAGEFGNPLEISTPIGGQPGWRRKSRHP